MVVTVARVLSQFLDSGNVDPLMRFFLAFQSWLAGTFIGPRGYTVYADGRLERGRAPGRDQDLRAAEIDTAQFNALFGPGSSKDGRTFFVPRLPARHANASQDDNVIPTEGAGEAESFGGMQGSFHREAGELVAVAEFVWNRAGVRLSLTYVWICLGAAMLDVLAGLITLAQGDMTIGRAIVIGLTLMMIVLFMFAPRLLNEGREHLSKTHRAPLLAKLSAFVQFAGRST
ncbi:MAG: hypothetical protein RIC29_15430 [Rhodospirillaceae bacterium]